jgi:hypothetical protein
MKSITSLYLESLSSMTPVQKMNRISSLYTDMKNMTELQIRRECKDISQYELKKKIAQRMYSSDTAALTLIDDCFNTGLNPDGK